MNGDPFFKIISSIYLFVFHKVVIFTNSFESKIAKQIIINYF